MDARLPQQLCKTLTGSVPTPSARRRKAVPTGPSRWLPGRWPVWVSESRPIQRPRCARKRTGTAPSTTSSLGPPRPAARSTFSILVLASPSLPVRLNCESGWERHTWGVFLPPSQRHRRQQPSHPRLHPPPHVRRPPLRRRPPRRPRRPPHQSDSSGSCHSFPATGEPSGAAVGSLRHSAVATSRRTVGSMEAHHEPVPLAALAGGRSSSSGPRD